MLYFRCRAANDGLPAHPSLANFVNWMASPATFTSQHSAYAASSFILAIAFPYTCSYPL